MKKQNQPPIKAMLASEDELIVTVAELWRLVQAQRRQLETLNDRLCRLEAALSPGGIGRGPPEGGTRCNDHS